MTPERFQRIKQAYWAVAARPESERAAALGEICGDDATLRQEVDALLAQHGASAFFNTPAIARAAPDLAAQPGSWIGRRLGPYAITRVLGVGGMGEVYGARDSQLGRDVAIKILPAVWLVDPERRARFDREARVLAALNHPNIAAIYGVVDIAESDSVRALVLELVEGGTLADRLADGPLPIDEALTVAAQIAGALEAAHERGIIHRDLKPSNIAVAADGTVKVLDFGLAKVDASQPAAGTPLSHSPTLTASVAGILLGTAAYMSPEQVNGQETDRRSDVWAFGCVLYETLSGRAAFEGETVSEILASVLKSEPDWTRLPRATPPGIRRVLRRCLQKNRRERLHDMGDVRLELEDARREPHVGDAIAKTSRRSERLAWAAALAVAAGVTWLALRPLPPRVSRLAITTTPAAALALSGVERDLAITPDGSRVVYGGNNGRALFVRPLDALESVSLLTGETRGPFVSPDGHWVGFNDGALALKKVAIEGGPPQTITTIDGSSRGATWTPDDVIVFATSATETGLQQVPAAGGPTTVLTTPDQARGEADHVWPELLPGGRAVLFTIWPATGGIDAAQIAVLDRQTGKQTVVVRGGSHAHYVRSGHLVYAAGNTLRAVAFDPVRLEIRGAPAPVVRGVVTTGTVPGGGVDAVFAADGTLAYVSGVGPRAEPRTLVWVDRQGRETPLNAPPRVYVYVRISPDGRRIVVNPADQEIDLWLLDPARPTLTRLTFTPGIDNAPVWTPDGRRLIFASEREGTRNLFWQAADGAGTAERLTRSPDIQHSTAVSPDGSRVIFHETTPTTGDDVMQMELKGTRTITPLVRSPFTERNGIVSPDGRWLAYEADDSGQFQIYVRPYPDVNSGRWQVSSSGGTRPLWSRNGQELFYVSLGGAILRVGVERGTSWAATTPATIVKEGYLTATATNSGRTYDLSPDGQRFLVVKPAREPNAPPEIVVVQHFDQELERLVPRN